VSLLRRPSAGLLAALLLAGCSASQPTDAIVVGHLAPFSGPDKLVGEHARQGIILAVEEVNGDGEKIDGRRVEVHHADDGGTAALAGDKTVRLIAVTRAVALLGGTSSEHAEQIARAAQPYGVALVTPSPLPAPLAGETAFSTCLPPALQGQVLARFAAQELKAKRVAVVVDARSAVCNGLAAGFAKEFAADGERQADPYRYENETGFAGLPGRVAKGKPDAVLIAAPVADFVRLREGLAKEDVKGPLLFGGEETAWPALAAEPDAGRDVYAVTTFAADGLTPRGEEFAKKYRDRFNEAPDLYAASAYDGARLLFEAMRRTRPLKAEGIGQALAAPDPFDSLTGPLTIDKEDHGARRPSFVVRRQDGQVKVVKRYDANLK
jgi:branched-chain amino acid transport system substrate-binding protein